MADEVKISDLPAAASVNAAMQFEVNDAGVSRRVTAGQVVDLISPRVTYTEQDIRMLALLLAEQRGDRVNMIDGIADPLTDGSDLLLQSGGSLASGAFTSTAGSAGNIATLAQATFSPTTGTPANAFDGNANTYWTGNTATTCLIRQDFGTPKRLASVQYLNNASFGGYAPSAVVVEWSDDGVSWTSAATLTSAGGASGNAGVLNTVTIPASVTAHRYWQIRQTQQSASGFAWYVAEVYFNLFQYNNIDLRSVSFPADFLPTTARIVVQIAPAYGEPLPTILTDLQVSVLRNGGSTYKAITSYVVETMADGTTLIDALVDLTTLGSGANMRWRVTTTNNKPVSVTGVVLQWRN